MNRAMDWTKSSALDWIKNNLHPDGGMRCWPDGKAYPEVTGYLIPTLLKYGEFTIAQQFAEWLSNVQNEDGSFDGLDGVRRSFDTAACLEGLQAVSRTDECSKAWAWLEGMHEDGIFWTSTTRLERNDYTLRVNGLLGIDRPMPDDLAPNRAHYMAYALEGALLLGHENYVLKQLKWIRRHLNDGFAPYEIVHGHNFGSDLCATAQLGVLFTKCGMGDQGTLKALEVASASGYENSWTAKYHLDLLSLYDHEPIR